MPGLVKIGFTRRSVHQRLIELSFGTKGMSATGVPGAFMLVNDWPIDYDMAHEIEQRVHHAMREHRVKAHGGRRAREFFWNHAADRFICSASVLLISARFNATSLLHSQMM